MTASLQTPAPDEILEVAQAAARSAGEILVSGWDRPKETRFKGEINLVTDFDLAAERAIVDRIKAAFPEHVILAEESGLTGPDSQFRWYIDPLDGTTNFAHGFPVFCVSIAWEIHGPAAREIRAGVVFDPLRQEMFTAYKGLGAWMNGHPLAVSEINDLGRALLATGFPYDLHQKPDPVLTRFRNVCLAAQAVRRAGAAALDLAYVAAGRVDGFWEEGLYPWDTAAGILMVEEAGGRVTDLAGRPYNLQGKEILATNGRVHYNLSRILSSNETGRNDAAAVSKEEAG
ncbi:MAG: inositol monophosphatase family protein [Thermodesulfobacteriota bacterium]